MLWGLFCKHKFEFHRNIGGDELSHQSVIKRSEWKCDKCGKYEKRDKLFSGVIVKL